MPGPPAFARARVKAARAEAHWATEGVAASYGSASHAPGSSPPLPKISKKKTTGKVAGGRRRACFTAHKQFDPSGKSAGKRLPYASGLLQRHQILLHIDSGESPSSLIVESAALSGRSGRQSIHFQSMVERPTTGRPIQAGRRHPPHSSKKGNCSAMPIQYGPKHLPPARHEQRSFDTCSIGKKYVRSFFSRMHGIKVSDLKVRGLATPFRRFSRVRLIAATR